MDGRRFGHKKTVVSNKFIKSKKKTNLTGIKELNINNNVATDSQETADCLNRHFASIGKQIVNEVHAEVQGMPHDNHDTSNFKEIAREIEGVNSLYLEAATDKEILNVVNCLKRNAAPGEDQVTVSNHCILGPSLIQILTKLVNRVFTAGIFPNELKFSRITPVLSLAHWTL